MPLILSPPPPVRETVVYPRKRWTREECHFLRDSGLLGAGRYELIEGDIVFVMGQNEPHAYVIMRLLEALVTLFGFAHVRSQLPLYLDTENEPEPDAIVTLLPLRDYLSQDTPTAADARLVAEASDSILTGDLTVKARVYARSGIREYWVVDIAGRRLIVHRQPTPEGYTDIVAYDEHEALSPLAAPHALVRVTDLLP